MKIYNWKPAAEPHVQQLIATHPVLTAILVALLVRALLLGVWSLDTGLQPRSLVDGHDGAEYLAFAGSLADGSIQGVPAEARRHDPGLAMLLAPVIRLTGSKIAAWLVTMGCLLAALSLYYSLLRRHSATDQWEAVLLILALPLVYPTQVYFSGFVLTESLFMALGLAATLLFLNGRTVAAYAMIGLMALVRAPGILLAPALFCADWLSRRERFPRGGRLMASTLALLPPLIWATVTRSIWHETTFSIHRPQFGLPFSGFAGLVEVGTVRACYVLAAVSFFIASTIRLVTEAHRAGWRSPFLNAASLFCSGFLVFHLCLRTLYYVDRTIYTFNYQDRYYVGLLPFALYAWRGVLKPWVIATGAVVSIVLSVWWGHNYFLARAG